MNFPVVFISAEGQFDLTGTEKRNLRKYIENGGFLVVNDANSDTPNSTYMNPYQVEKKSSQS